MNSALPFPHIPKSELEPWAWYKGRCRNAIVAMWDPRSQVFLYIRHKFGNIFIEEIEHPEDDRGFDVFYPTEKL